MCIPTRPVIYHCPRCHWTMLSTGSDAIVPGEPYTHCPDCGSADLQRTRLPSWRCGLIGALLKVFSQR